MLAAYQSGEESAKGPGGRRGLSEGFKRIARAAGVDIQTVEGYVATFSINSKGLVELFFR